GSYGARHADRQRPAAGSRGALGAPAEPRRGDPPRRLRLLLARMAASVQKQLRRRCLGRRLDLLGALARQHAPRRDRRPPDAAPPRSGTSIEWAGDGGGDAVHWRGGARTASEPRPGDAVPDERLPRRATAAGVELVQPTTRSGRSRHDVVLSRYARDGWCRPRLVARWPDR